MATYQERVARYRIVKQETITDISDRASFVINGLNPDEVITLQYSYDTKEEAERQLDRCREIEDIIIAQFGKVSGHHYIIDNGEAEVIERQAF